jgi:hypothetical protein
MKQQTSVKFLAFDGTAFDDKEACKAYEAEGFLTQFVGWKKERVVAADAGDTDKGKKDAIAIEKWATRLKMARAARGEIRVRKPKGDAPATAQDAPQTEPVEHQPA